MAPPLPRTEDDCYVPPGILPCECPATVNGPRGLWFGTLPPEAPLPLRAAYATRTYPLTGTYTHSASRRNGPVYPFLSVVTVKREVYKNSVFVCCDLVTGRRRARSPLGLLSV